MMWNDLKEYFQKYCDTKMWFWPYLPNFLIDGNCFWGRSSFYQLKIVKKLTLPIIKPLQVKIINNDNRYEISIHVSHITDFQICCRRLYWVFFITFSNFRFKIAFVTVQAKCTQKWYFLVSNPISYKISYCILVPQPFLCQKIGSNWTLNRFL